MSLHQIHPELQIGTLAEKQYDSFTKFREYVQSTGNYNSKFNDDYLLRFSRARKFDFEKTKLMWDNFIKWRKEQDIDNVNDISFDHCKETLWKNYQHNHAGVAKNGRPLFIERVGIVQYTPVISAVGLDGFLKYAI